MKTHLYRAILIVVVAMLVCSARAYGQAEFKFEKRRGHYYLSTTVNDTPGTEILLSSAIPGIVIGEDIFNRLFNESDFVAVEPSNEKFYAGDSHSVVKKVLNGKVMIGGRSYSGNVYVVDNFDKISVPVLQLKNESDTTACLVRFNFKKQTLEFINRDAVDTRKMHSYKLISGEPRPIFEATIELADTYDHDGEITANFIFDLANGTPIFLYKDSALSFIKRNKFRILPATDKAGNVLGRGIYAGYCKLGDRVVNGISIGITDTSGRYSDGILGSVGPVFFENKYVVFDPHNGVIWYE